jgi:WD40 repeat protein
VLSQINTVSFSPDSELLLVGGMGTFARVFDRNTGAELKRFASMDEGGFRDDSCSAIFSHDAKFVITGSCLGTIHVFDAETGKEVKRFKGHSDAVRTLAPSPEGNYLLTGSGSQPDTIPTASNDSSVRLWDLRTGTEVQVFLDEVRFTGGKKPSSRGETRSQIGGSVRTVAFLADGRIGAASSDGVLLVWDATTGRLLHRINTGSGFSSAAFSPDKKLLLVGSNNGAESMRVVETGTVLQEFQGPKGIVLASAWSADGKTIITGWSASAVLQNSLNGKILLGLIGNGASVIAVKMSLDGQLLLIITIESLVRQKSIAHLWRLTSGEETRTFEVAAGFPMPYVGSIAISPTSKFILSANGHQNNAEMFDARTGAVVQRFTSHSGPARSVAFSHDGKLIAVGSSRTGNRKSSVGLWDAETGAELHPLPGYNDEIKSVTFSPDDRFLLTTTEDEIRLWRLSDRHEEWRKRVKCSWFVPAAFSPDGRWILGADCFPDDPRLVRPLLWEVTSGEDVVRPLWHKPGGIGGAAAIFPSTNQLFTDSWSHYDMKLWDITRDNSVQDFVANELSPITTAASSKDGKLLAAGYLSGNIRLWHNDSLENSQSRLYESKAAVGSIEFSSDNRFLITGHLGGTVQLWDVSTGAQTTDTPFLTLIGFPDGHWGVFDSAGHFDANDLYQFPLIRTRAPIGAVQWT